MLYRWKKQLNYQFIHQIRQGYQLVVHLDVVEELDNRSKHDSHHQSSFS